MFPGTAKPFKYTYAVQSQNASTMVTKHAKGY
jgi:hypothetical protein